MEWKSFEITAHNDFSPDKTVIMHSERGDLWVRVGTVDICISQSDDFLGVIIDTYDNNDADEPIDSMAIYYPEENDK